MNISQEKLAIRAGLSRNCVQQMECHEHIPQVATLFALIDALDLDLYAFICLMLRIRFALRKDRLLHRLGATANYSGVPQTAFAVALCVQSQDRLLLITKNLYPDVASHFNTNWKAVERNIRSVRSVVWVKNPSLLDQIAQRHLSAIPKNAQFLAILSYSLLQAPSPAD